MIKSIGGGLWKLTVISAVLSLLLPIGSPHANAATPPPPAVPAVSADDFLNSISIGTHIGNGWDYESKVAPCLTYLGVRNIRDDGSTNSAIIQDYINLHTATGVQACLTPPWGIDVTNSIPAFEKLEAAGALLAVEGPNEPGNEGWRYNGVYADGTKLNTTTVAAINNSAYETTGYHNNSSAGYTFGPVAFTYASSTPFVTGEADFGVLRNDLTANVGFKFTVGASPIVVNELGRWVVSGNTGTHAVKLVNASSGDTLGTVSVNTAGATPGAFKYVALSTPVTLAANTAYYILSAETSGGDQWYDGQYNAQTVAYFQRDLYKAIKADPKLKDVPVFSSSMSGGSEPENYGLQFLTIPSGAGTLMPTGTIYADFANNHNYLCGSAGHMAAPVSNDAWDAEDPTLSSSWDGLYCEFGHTWAGHFTGYTDTELLTLPRVTTETGWQTQGTHSVTQDQQGKLFLNVFLDAFKRGWSFTSIYMLRDASGGTQEGYWGLYDENYYPKLSANYVHNLTTLLADTTTITPGALAYSIPNEPVTVHDLLIEKSTGKFELAVWDENISGSDKVTVNFSATYPSVKIYDPTVGITATQTLTNVSSVPLTLSDHPLIIEIPFPVPISATSRKKHGSAETSFDIPISYSVGSIPPAGLPPVECREGSTTELIVTFTEPIVSLRFNVGPGAAAQNGYVGYSGNTVAIPLKDITDQQTVQINLTNIKGADGSILANATLSFRELVGDVNGDGTVTAADATAVQNAIGSKVGESGFNPRTDVDLSGTVTANDVSVVTKEIGHHVP